MLTRVIYNFPYCLESTCPKCGRDSEEQNGHLLENQFSPGESEPLTNPTDDKKEGVAWEINNNLGPGARVIRRAVGFHSALPPLLSSKGTPLTLVTAVGTITAPPLARSLWFLPTHKPPTPEGDATPARGPDRGSPIQRH